MWTKTGVALCATLLACVSPAVARQADPPRSRLAAGVPIEAALGAGEGHVYVVDLAADQFMSLSVLQQGIDVAVSLHAADGATLLEVDGPTGKYGSERLRLIAPAAAAYRVEVHSHEKGAPAGRYRLEVGELRVADADDRRRIEAQTAYFAAIQLRIKGTGESLRRALEQYERAGDLWRSVGDVVDEATAVNDLGYAYRLLSDYGNARDRYQQALELRRRAGDGVGEAQTLGNLGALGYLLGENQQALQFYEQALALRRVEGNPQEEALMLSNIGEVFALWSEHQKALDYFRQALPAQRKTGDRLRESLTLSNLGLVYNNTGQSREALKFFDEALVAARAIGNRRVEARILGNRGAASRDLGDLAAALASYEQALALQRKAGDRLGESETLNAIGVILMRQGKDEEALQHYRQALSLQQAVGSRRNQAATLNNLAAVLTRRNALDEAFTALTDSLTLRRAVQDRRGEADSLAGLARVHRARGRLPDALAAGEAALEIVESLRTKLVGQEMRASSFAASLEMYELVTATLMELDAAAPGAGHAARAFHVVERARARALLDGLAEAQGGIRQGVPTELRDRERSLHDRISVRAERQIQLLSGSHTPQDAERASREMDGLLTELRELDADIRARSPRYADLTRPRPLDAAAVQAQILDPDTLLLEYALGTERSFLWVLTPSSIDAHRLPPRAEIEGAARRFYGLLTARNEERPDETAAARRRRIAASDAELDTAAGVLSRMLLGPVQAPLAGRRLLIVADGALQYIPFGALPNPAAAAEPLIVRHEVVLAPSASALAVLRGHRGDIGARLHKVAIVADPVFSPDDPRLTGRKGAAVEAGGDGDPTGAADALRSGADIGISSFRRLRFSREEAATIAALTKPGDRFEAVGFRASRATATTTDLSGYGIVHFSTHGLLNTTHPELSGLVLSLYDEQGRPQDGFLRLLDIYNMKLDADLVVLSACETALGREIRGEGLIGLARGFMYAGTSRVVASLWNVEDQATATLMKRFYQGLLTNGESPAAALRSAQIAMWRAQRWRSPYYWAAFVTQGEWR